MSKRWVLALLVGCCVVVAFCRSSSHNAAKSKTIPPRHVRWAVAAFSPNNAQQIQELVRVREIAIQTAATVLESHAARGDMDYFAVLQAVEFLGEVGADDPQAIRALIANLDVHEIFVSEPGPLTGLAAAQSLRRIGGRNVIEELMHSLRVPRTEKEQLIIANILQYIDTPQVAAYRLQVAIEEERARPNANLQYIEQLEAVKYWLDNPKLLNDLDNWPSHM